MLVAFFAFAAAAVEPGPEGQRECFNSNLSQMEMNACARHELEGADKMLNAVWMKAKAIAKDDPETTKLLLQSQRAWLKFRDAQCELIADESRGGSITPLTTDDCLTALTRERSDELKEFIESRGAF